MMENLLKKWKKVICQNDLWWVTIKSPKQKRKPREERILKHLILGWHARITSYYSRISGGWCLVTSFLWDGFFFFRTLSWLHLTGVSTTPCWQTSPTKRLSQRWLQKSLSPRITHGSVVSMNCIFKPVGHIPFFTEPWSSIIMGGRSVPSQGWWAHQIIGLQSKTRRGASRIWS